MVFTETFGEETVDLPALGTDEYAEIETTVRTNRREELTRYLNECKITGKDRFDALRDARPDAVNVAQVWAYLETSDGARRAFLLSAAKAGKTDEQARSLYKQLCFPDAVNLALSLCRLDHRKNLDGSPRVAPELKEGETKTPPLPGKP